MLSIFTKSILKYSNSLDLQRGSGSGGIEATK